MFDTALPPAVPGPVPTPVVGTGPNSLVTALGLAQQGARCVVLQAGRQVSEGSRAIVFARRSMEIVLKVGASDAIVQMALPWRPGNSFYRGQQVFRREAAHGEDERFVPMNNLHPQTLEQFLIDTVTAQPLIELRWGHEADAVLQGLMLVHLVLLRANDLGDAGRVAELARTAPPGL